MHLCPACVTVAAAEMEEKSIKRETQLVEQLEIFVKVKSGEM